MPDPASLPILFALLLMIGAFSGVIAGLLGVGGGIVLVPAFFHTFAALGYGAGGAMRVAIGTSLATIIVTSVRSLMAHNRRGAVDWPTLRGWGPGLALGAAVGAALVTVLGARLLQAVFGGLALVISYSLIFGAAEGRLGRRLPVGRLRAALSGAVGLLSVLMGIGGGSFGVPLMVLYGAPIHRAVATASGWGVVIAVPSVAVLLLTPVTGAPPWTVGAVNLPAFAAIIALSWFTTPLGVRLAHALNPVPLRRAFAVFLALVALNMLRKAAGL